MDYISRDFIPDFLGGDCQVRSWVKPSAVVPICGTGAPQFYLFNTLLNLILLKSSFTESRSELLVSKPKAIEVRRNSLKQEEETSRGAKNYSSCHHQISKRIKSVSYMDD